MDGLSAPITRVTVAEDRAVVTREAAVQVSEGVTRLEFSQVSPILADKTLVFESDVVEILDYGVNRRIAGKDQEEHEFDRLLQKKEEVEAEKRLLSNRKSEIREFADQLLSEISEEAAWGRADQKQWQKLMTDLRKQETAVDERLSELRKEQRELANRLKQTKKGEVRLTATVYCVVSAPAQSTTKLTFRYAVPCACWRPAHRARVTGDDLELTAQACVWQKTGEDWTDVELSFSTERTAQTTSLPRLTPDRLSLKAREEEVVLSVREETVERLEKPSVQTVKTVPGIEDGGETFAIKAGGRHTVVSDGQPGKVRLFQFRTKTAFHLEATPELLEQVTVASQQINEASSPLLSGPVELNRNGRLLGAGWLTFTAPGSRFELNWGPHPDLTVSRTFDSKEEKEKMLKGWVKTERRIHVYLGNNSGQEKKIRVTERIPVSESSDLKIELNRTYTHLAEEANEDGFITWDIRLAPHQRLKIPLSYSMNRKKRAVVN